MAVFEFSLPDGRTVEIDAPDMGQAENALRLTIGNMPDPPAQPAAAEPTGQGFGNNVAQAAGDGLFMGFGDEISARLNSWTGYDANTGTYGNWGTTYDDQLAAVRGQEKQFREDHPIISTGAEIGGGVAAALVPVGAVARGASLGQQALRGAGVGAAMGGAYGFAEGEGGFAERMGNVPVNAAVGGVIGGTIPPIGNLVGRGVRSAQDYARNSRIGRSIGDALGIDRKAGNILSDLVGMGNPDAMAQALARGGDGAMLADANPAMVDALDTIMRMPGDGARIASERIDDRAAQASYGILDALVPQQGPRVPPVEAQRRMAQGARGEISQAYQRAYNTAIDYSSEAGREIENIVNRLPPKTARQAIQRATDRMIYDGAPNAQIMASIADDGAVTFQQMPNVMQLDYLKRAFDEIAEDGKDAVTGRLNSEGAFASRIARDLREATANAVPAYQDALSSAASDIRQRGAVRTGGELLRPQMSVETAAEAIADATPAELRAMRTGVVGQIEHVLGNVRAVASDPNIDARQALTAYKELSSPNAQRKMEALFGDDWPGIQKALDEAGSALGLRAGTAANSRTAGREAFRDLLDDATAPGALARGEPIGTARSVWQRLTGASPDNIQRVQAGVRDQLADVLTRPGADVALALVESARRAGRINPALSGQVNSAVVRALMGSLPQSSFGLGELLRQ